MKYEDIPKEELKLVSEKMIGIVLMNAGVDSNGNPIHPNNFYRVEQHIPSGMLILFPTGANMEHEFINDIWAKSGKLN